MTISIRDAGAWKSATMHVRDAGAWKAVQNGYVRDAGVWKQFFAALSVAFSHTSASRLNNSGGAATATYQLALDGSINATQGLTGLSFRGTWITPTSAAGAAYECWADSETAGVTGTFRSWLPLNANHSWSITQPAGTGSGSGSMTLQIRRASDGVVLAGPVTISFTVEAAA